MADGLSLDEAVMATLIEPLTDDPMVKKGLVELARVVLG
jgi:hypothetical protein